MSKHKLLKPLLGLTAAAVLLPLYAVAPGHASRRQKKIFRGVNYAHRGLHTRDKSVPENSLAAFRQAAQEGYGIELDVQLSKDGEVVVFHDDTLDRVCGVHARVDELTWPELQQLRLCGTDEQIPLFSEVLKNIQGCEALIVELKNGVPHHLPLHHHPQNALLCGGSRSPPGPLLRTLRPENFLRQAPPPPPSAGLQPAPRFGLTRRGPSIHSTHRQETGLSRGNI